MTFDTRRKPRQKRSKEKVDKILDAVEQLANDEGIEALTTTNVAEVTGFSVGTVYQYFDNRSELQAAAEERMFERLTQRVFAEAANVIGGPVEETIAKLIDVYLDNAKSQCGYSPLLTKLPSANEVLVELVSALIRGEYPDISELQLRITLNTMVNILCVLTDLTLMERDPELQSRYQEELVAHCMYALRRAGERCADG